MRPVAVLGMKILDAGPAYAVVEMVLEDRHLNGFPSPMAALSSRCRHRLRACLQFRQCRHRGAAVPDQFPAARTRRECPYSDAKGRTNGRTGIYDVTITASDGGVIAEFRGIRASFATR